MRIALPHPHACKTSTRPRAHEQKNAGPDLTGGRANAGEFETGRRIVDGIICDHDPTGPGLTAEGRHRGHQPRMSGGAQLGRCGKGGIDLEQNLVAGPLYSLIVGTHAEAPFFG